MVVLLPCTIPCRKLQTTFFLTLFFLPFGLYLICFLLFGLNLFCVSGSGVDDVWRPGGAIDRNPAEDEDEEETNTTIDTENGGWNSTTINSSITSPTYENTTNIMADTNNNAWDTNTTTTTATAADPTTTSWTPADTTTELIKQESSTTIKTEDARGMDVTTMEPSEEAPVWFMERVCVQIKSTKTNAVIQSMTDNRQAMVTITGEENETKVVNASELTMVQPKEHDMVLVTKGADVGVEGELVCIDGDDAILKDANEDFKIVDYVHLAKIDSAET